MYVVCGSVKQLIQPGVTVNLSQSDIRHAGSSMRFFESVYKSQEIVNDLLRRKGIDVSPKEAPVAVEKEAVESPIVKEVSKDIEEAALERALEYLKDQYHPDFTFPDEGYQIKTQRTPPKKVPYLTF